MTNSHETQSNCIKLPENFTYTDLMTFNGLDSLKGNDGRLARLKCVVENSDKFNSLQLADSIQCLNQFSDPELYVTFNYSKKYEKEALEFVKILINKVENLASDDQKEKITTVIDNLEMYIAKKTDEVTQALQQVRADHI
jgi:hypothetical protein